MQTVVLNNSLKMPILGFGVYQIPDADQCERSVLDALETGYRSIDTAAVYMNEEAVGNAIRKSRIPRGDIFLTTKLWVSDSGYERAFKAFERSLNKLQTDYVDLYLIHQPYGDVFGSWRALEELYKTGRTKSIGVSNFHPDRVIDLMIHNSVPPAVNQIETHPFHQQVEMQGFLKDNGIQIESWGPFAEGKNNLFMNKVLTSVGKKHGKSVAQVCLRWLIQRDVVVIPKTVNKHRMIENFNIFDFNLDEQDMTAIRALDTKTSLFFDHRNPVMVRMLGKIKV